MRWGSPERITAGTPVSRTFGMHPALTFRVCAPHSTPVHRASARTGRCGRESRSQDLSRGTLEASERRGLCRVAPVLAPSSFDGPCFVFWSGAKRLRVPAPGAAGVAPGGVEPGVASGMFAREIARGPRRRTQAESARRRGLLFGATGSRGVNRAAGGRAARVRSPHGAHGERGEHRERGGSLEAPLPVTIPLEGVPSARVRVPRRPEAFGTDPLRRWPSPAHLPFRRSSVCSVPSVFSV